MRVLHVTVGAALLLGVGCLGGDSEPAGTPSPTATLVTTATATATLPTATPTSTSPPPSPTPAPATTPTPALEGPIYTGTPGEPVAARVITDNLNVRGAPDLDNVVVGQLRRGAEVTIVGRYVRTEWLAISDVGWVFYDPDWLDLSVDFERIGPPPIDANGAYAVVGGAPHPAMTRTGIPAIDVVIEAMHAQDADALGAMLAFQTIPCVAREQYGGGPPGCRGGDPVGTPYEVLPFSSSEFAWLNREQAVETVRGLAVGGAAGEPWHIYAAREFTGTAVSPGGYTAIFTRVETHTAIAFGVDDDGVTYISTPWDGNIGGGSYLREDARSRLVLPSPVPEGLLPPP